MESSLVFARKLWSFYLGSEIREIRVVRLIKPLHSNISIHILHTVLYTSLEILTRRIGLKIKSSKVGDNFLYSCDPNFLHRGNIVRSICVALRGQQRVKFQFHT